MAYLKFGISDTYQKYHNIIQTRSVHYHYGITSLLIGYIGIEPEKNISIS